MPALEDFGLNTKELLVEQNRETMGKLIAAEKTIERLRDAKRRALAIADERSKENVALRAALKPFADIADLVNHTDRRDGERVYELPRKPGGAGYFTLVREDFRRAARAYGPVDLRITQPKPLAVEQKGDKS